MGKAPTYSAQTQFRQQALRLRALKDNPRNPAEIGAIGSDWAVDDPGAIVEEGSNRNGSYTIYARGRKEMILKEAVYRVEPTVLTYTHILPIAAGDLNYRVTLTNHQSLIGGFNSYNTPLKNATTTNLQFFSSYQKQDSQAATIILKVESDS